MADLDINRYVRWPGSLYLSPTAIDKTSGFGTRLGRVEQLVVRRAHARVRLTQEPFGETPVDEIGTGETVVVGAACLSFDADLLGALFTGQIGTSPTAQVAGYDGLPALAGSPRSQRAVPILFVPDDYIRQHLFFMPRALPWLGDETAEIRATLAEDAAFPAVFVAIPQQNGTLPWRMFRFGTLTGLGLGAYA